MQWRTHRRRMGVVGGLALALSSAIALAWPVPTGAQTDESTRTETAKVGREAYFTAPAAGALPATVTAEFPPGIVCILVPQVCGSSTAPIRGPVGGAQDAVLDAVLPEDHLAPQPVEANTLPVGMLGGKPRYTSYLQFALPAIPSGSIIDRFDLVLSQTAVSYALESPAFRQAILAGLVTYQTRSPAEFTKFVGDVASRTTPLATTRPTGIELCAVTETWASVRSGDAAAQPPKDCIFGANGVFDERERTWTFDLSLLAQAWLDGTLPNEGVYLGPIGAENLAFGDPDTSTNWQLSLAGSGASSEAARPRIRFAFSEGFGDEGSFEDLSGELPLDDSGLAADFGGAVGTTDPLSVSGFDDSALTGATPGGEAAASGNGQTGPPARATLAAQSRPRTPWWLWLLLPTGLALAYAFSRSLEEEPPARRAGGGALTRMMAGSSPPST